MQQRRSWQPPSSGSNFVRTGARKGEVVREQDPFAMYYNNPTRHSVLADHHIRKRFMEQQENERKEKEKQDRLKEEGRRYKEEQQRAYEEFIRRQEEQKQQKQSPKRRSKSPSPPKKRSASPTSPEPPEGIERDIGPKPHNCESFKKYPVRPTGDKKTKKIQFRRQLLLFHPDKNIGCSEKAKRKTVVLYEYKDEDPMFAGGKSKRKSKRASKRTAKKRSGK